MISTKEQERKALEQIRKIVDGLGEDSYIAAAFDGCFAIAAENIENDFACSMKARALSAESERKSLKIKVDALTQKNEELVNENTNHMMKYREDVGKLNRLVDDYREIIDSLDKDKEQLRSGIAEVSEENEAMKQEIITLKAKLYDLITLED